MSSVNTHYEGTPVEMYHRYLQCEARKTAQHWSHHMDASVPQRSSTEASEASFLQGPALETLPSTPSPGEETPSPTTSGNSGNSLPPIIPSEKFSVILWGLGRRDNTRTAEQNDSSRRAWMTVFASALYMFLSQGEMLVQGLMMEKIGEEFTSMKGQYWACGLCALVATLTCCVLGPIMDAYGPLFLCYGATCFTSGYPFALARCTRHWQYLLCMGVLGGIAKGLCMAVAAPMSAKIFKKRVGVAQAVIMSGSSLGGVLYSQYFKYAFNNMGWKDAMQNYAIILGTVAHVAFLLSMSYHWIVPAASLQTDTGGKQSVLQSYASWKEPFRNKAFVCFAGAMAFLDLGIYGMCVVTPQVANQSDIKGIETADVITGLSGASLFGRIIGGLMADRFGYFDTFLLSLSAEMVILGAFCTSFAHRSPALFLTSAVQWGLFSGSWMSLFPACLGLLCRVQEFGKNYGALTFALSIPVFSATPLYGAIERMGGSSAVYGFTLLFTVLGFSGIFSARGILVGEFWVFCTGR